MESPFKELLGRFEQLSLSSNLPGWIGKAIALGEVDPEMALTRGRKVLDFIIRQVFESCLKEPAGTRPLETLQQRIVKENHFPRRLAAYANAVRELGNVGTHSFDEPVTAADVLQSLNQLLPVVEWYVKQEFAFVNTVVPATELGPEVSHPPVKAEGSERTPKARAAVHPQPTALAAFARGLLPEDQAETVANHVAGCTTCKATVDTTPPDHVLRMLSGVLGAADFAGGAATITFPPPPAACPVPGALRRQNKYQDIGLIGAGGMGLVFKAWQPLASRFVALKVIQPDLLGHPAARAHFLREARAMSQLDHPNIVRVHDVEAVEDLIVIAMEYLEGKNLLEAGQGGKLPLADACRYTQQAARGLEHAHDKGFVHRDIKPANLKIGANGEVKILDFGLVRSFEPNDGSQQLTGSHDILGTPNYMAPEQAQDAAGASHQADLYALGCTLFYLLTGQPPFQGKSVIGMLVAQANAAPPSVAQFRKDVPAELEALVRRLLAKDPQQRPQKAAEVVAALEPFVKPANRTEAKVVKEPERRQKSAPAQAAKPTLNEGLEPEPKTDKLAAPPTKTATSPREPVPQPCELDLESLDEIRKALGTKPQGWPDWIEPVKGEIAAYRPVHRPPMALLCVLDDGSDDGQWRRLRGDRFVIGRVEGDLVIPHESMMSRQHVEIARQPIDGRYRWLLTDLASKNGTFVRVSKTILTDGQEILLGSRRFRFSAGVPGTAGQARASDIAKDLPKETAGWQSVAAAEILPMLVELTPQGDGQRFILTMAENWLGSAAGRCNIVLGNDPMLSPRHARLSRDPRGRWYLENAGSRNGTWVIERTGQACLRVAAGA